jgi:selenophosphate synthase
MFSLDLNKVGCGHKVEMKTIGSIASLVGIEPHADAGCDEIHGTEICSTIDRIGRMTENVSEFAEISILHTINDLLVSGTKPKAASVCIEFGPELETVEQMADLTAALKSVLLKYKIKLQNLHSIRSEYTYLTISVFGLKDTRQPPNVRHGSIFLTRAIGASKMMVLTQMEGDSAEPFVAEIVNKRYQGNLQSEFCATDVTGFGLAGAAYNLCGRLGVSAQITLGYEHLVHPDVLSIPVRCFEAKGLPDQGIVFSSRHSALVASCIEFAGPVLIFLSSESEAEFFKEFSNLHGRQPLKVGAFATDERDIGVSFNWKD